MSRRSAVTLTILIALGFGVRLGYLFHATSQPGYEWVDPDHYERKGRILAQDGEGWRWTFEAVTHAAYGSVYMLPPGYPVFLSLFALLPGYPFTAQVGQVVLSTATIALLFFMGNQLHSERAGLLAAGIYAAWLPNIIAVWSTMQEAIYVPLVCLAFVLLMSAVQNRGRSWQLAVAGLVFGLATLTRSMPMYVLPLFALVLLFRERRRGLWTTALLFGGFLAVTLPYSVALTSHLGRFTFVENHGSIFIVERYGEGELRDGDPASLTRTASILVNAFVDAPGATVADWWTTTKSVFHVNGGRLLQIYLAADTKLGALAAKGLVHLCADALFIVCLLLAPLGAVLGRRPDAAAFFVIWTAVNVGLVALSGFGGARLRAPFEPHLIALAAVVLSGTFRAADKRLLAGATAIAAAMAWLVLPQLPASLRAFADYGVQWPLETLPKRSAMIGRAGFNVPAVDESVQFYVRARNPAGETDVEVLVDGNAVERVRLATREHRFELDYPGVLAYVELTATDTDTGAPLRLFVVVPRRT